MSFDDTTIIAPNAEFSANAYVKDMDQYHELYNQSVESPEEFWGPIAKQFHWETPYDPESFLTYNFNINEGPISIKWMQGASTNISYNLLDRNVKNGHGDTVAFYW